MIISETFDTNHVRRHSDKGVKIHNSKDGYDYDVAEDWVDEWFFERGLIAPIYIETDTPIETEQK